ncbi:uncharacterized protein DUF4906 [Dysgonomonas alginatilytica]|uniref:Uncharacterized protein DUF4906 n=1 Tax=Dysgonomonas alginatilytica TaxID=1605892 RepID=A0A2V3PJ35_9BACT|nr:DUF4906 domain-containing protein [Dysgonomonas alginatilytica]PXV60102.1 uncharacterized protein DUF4906 [Dysgonomonas alginatilytica]
MFKLILYGLLCTVLYSCNKADEANINLPTATYQTAYLQVGIDEAFTYATIEGSTAENEIRSVAFFVVTAKGEFSKYLSTEPLNSERGLSTALSGSPGNYKVSVTIKSSDFSGTTDIYVIANYAQNGLADKLLEINSLNDLQKLQSIALTENGTNLQCPLLMYAKQSLALTAEGTTKTTINLKRMAARVDVTDHINDVTKFKLISVQVFNPKTRTYLLPSEDNPLADITSVPRLNKLSYIKTDKTINLYIYETVEAESNLLPVLTIQVVYEFNGIGQIQNFPFKGIDGKAIRIERNKVYTIHFSLDDNKNLSFSPLVVDDFDKGEIEI